jgi:hypothetical protein
VRRSIQHCGYGKAISGQDERRLRYCRDGGCPAMDKALMDTLHQPFPQMEAFRKGQKKPADLAVCG